jgi:ribosomal protein S18 acetylase RimI-like enzyme
MECKIRKAGAADARLVSVLGTVTFYEAYYEQDTPEDMARYVVESFNPEVIAAEIADPTIEFYIPLLNEKAVGYAKLITGTTAEGIDDGGIELKRIYILERVWGTGVGERLLNFCIEKARERGFKFIWLGVWEENARALKFYSKYGFTQVGTVTFPYGKTVGINKVLKLPLHPAN